MIEITCWNDEDELKIVTILFLISNFKLVTKLYRTNYDSLFEQPLGVTGQIEVNVTITAIIKYEISHT